MAKFKIIIVTGLSGSGKSTALAAFEDAGFYSVDNMPIVMLPQFLKLPAFQQADLVGIALGMDLREELFIDNYPNILKQIKKDGFAINIIFMEADDEIILQRYSQTRRKHPRAKGDSLLESIRFERSLMQGLKKDADHVIMLYRDGYYDEDTDDPDITDVYVRKNRHGPTGHHQRYPPRSAGYPSGDPAWGLI